MTSALTTRSEADFASGMMKFFMIVIVAVIMADIVTRVTSSSLTTQYIQSRMYQGVTDPRVCECRGTEVKTIDLINDPPYTPWVSAEFINDGPDSAFIAINDPDATFELKINESATVNRIGALERISSIYGSCEAGESADVRIIGEY